MVDKEIVLETVKKMYESGIEDGVVEQTLKDIGLSKAEISQYIAEIKGTGQPSAGLPVPHPPVEKKESAWPEPSESSIPETVVMPGARVEEQTAMHATTHAALENQADKTDELIAKIKNLEKKLGVFSSVEQGVPQEMVAVNQRLAVIEKQVSEIKSGLSATKSIMEKILETDRKVLNKL